MASRILTQARFAAAGVKQIVIIKNFRRQIRQRSAKQDRVAKAFLSRNSRRLMDESIDVRRSRVKAFPLEIPPVSSFPPSSRREDCRDVYLRQRLHSIYASPRRSHRNRRAAPSSALRQICPEHRRRDLPRNDVRHPSRKAQSANTTPFSSPKPDSTASAGAIASPKPAPRIFLPAFGQGANRRRIAASLTRAAEGIRTLTTPTAPP